MCSYRDHAILHLAISLIHCFNKIINRRIIQTIFVIKKVLLIIKLLIFSWCLYLNMSIQSITLITLQVTNELLMMLNIHCHKS